MKQKQIKQVRECVRRKPLQQILGFLGLVPAIKYGHHPSDSRVPLNLLKLLRSATKYWIQSAEGRPEGQKPYGYRVSRKWVEERLAEYNSILEARK